MKTPSSDLNSLLRRQRQSRSYTSDPISDVALNNILEVGRWTGSGQNKQPWRLVVIREQITKDAIAATKSGHDWVKVAPIVVGVATLGANADAFRFDTGRLAERLLLAAQAEDLGAAIIGFGIPAVEEKLRELLNVPDGTWVNYGVVIGHKAPAMAPAERKPGPARKPLSEIVVNERF